ncbi:MAG: YraN family protein [Candidatus Peribacteria bacterium]|nr:MAG: YraN family protein [Candidatus Peribacteria bacterium]
MAGGEIDIIAENEEERVFVEVKVVPADIELTDYISSAKIAAMTRTAETYNLRYPTDLLLRLDAIFVTDGSIREHFEHISFYL